MVKTAIVNVVATASVNQNLDFEELRKFKEIFHDSDVYGGRVAYFKTQGMKGKVSIFLSGKMISVGTKSEREAFAELKLAKRYLVGKGMIVNSTSLPPKVRNIVVTVDFEEAINLEELCNVQKMIYEPEQFPGGILQLEQPYKATILIFASGKAVIAGLKSSDQIKPMVHELEKLLKIAISQ